MAFPQSSVIKIGKLGIDRIKLNCIKGRITAVQCNILRCFLQSRRNFKKKKSFYKNSIRYGGCLSLLVGISGNLENEASRQLYRVRL